MPTSLTQLAAQIRADLVADEATEAWRTIRVELGIHLRQARAAFPSNTAFSVWMAENELEMDPDKRRALIEMAEHPELMTRIYTDTDNYRDRTILEKEFRPKLHSQLTMTPVDVPSPVEITPEPITEPVIQPEPETQTMNQEGPMSEPSTTAVTPENYPLPPMPAAKKQPGGADLRTALVIQHGNTGKTIIDWMRPLQTEEHFRKNKLSPLLAGLTIDTVKRVAVFVSTHDDLRPDFGSIVVGAHLFWREIPLELSKDFTGHLSKPDKIIRKVIEDWDSHIAPVLREWLAAGKPTDTRTWYKMRGRHRVAMAAPKISPELRAEAIAAGIDMDDTRFASLPEQSIRQIIANKQPRAYANEHSSFQLPDQPSPIRVFGRDIWPCPPGHHWTWREAFYAYHLWLEADGHLQAYEKRASVRGRMLMNPFAPILTNINGAVGAAFDEMVRAQFHHEDREADSFGPSKKLLFQGE
jgi:hypothetical protein